MRDFLRVSGGAGGGLFFVGRIGGHLFEVPVAAAQIPGGTLDPAEVPKYQTPLLIPPVMPKAGTLNMRGGKPTDYYEISMRQFAQQILPAGPAGHDRLGLRRGHVGEQEGPADAQRAVAHDRGHSGTAGAREVDQRAASTPDGNFLPHLLPVDPTLHWANPPGGDSRPRHATDLRHAHPGRTPARCRS